MDNQIKLWEKQIYKRLIVYFNDDTSGYFLGTQLLDLNSDPSKALIKATELLDKTSKSMPQIYKYLIANNYVTKQRIEDVLRTLQIMSDTYQDDIEPNIKVAIKLLFRR